MTVAAPLVALIGPTASGKSALALAIAKRTGAQILSVDSMQVYHGMDIGTAKPTRDEQRATLHHGIDLVDPSESFTVARFVTYADRVIADAKSRNVALVAAGGTPMYFKALFEGLFEAPEVDPAIRERLALQSNDVLHARLVEVDPPAAARIHLNDRKRLLRAMEVFESTGSPISSLQREWGQQTRHEPIWIGLRWDRDELNRRINARARQMIAAGWVDEVKSLLDHFGALSPTAGEAAGYAQIVDHLRGGVSLDDAVEAIKMSTRQLARRQIKWFRRFANVEWIDCPADLEREADRIVAQKLPLRS